MSIATLMPRLSKYYICTHVYTRRAASSLSFYLGPISSFDSYACGPFRCSPYNMIDTMQAPKIRNTFCRVCIIRIKYFGVCTTEATAAQQPVYLGVSVMPQVGVLEKSHKAGRIRKPDVKPQAPSIKV